MELKDLGFNEWFKEKLSNLDNSNFTIARVTRVEKDRYLIRNGDSEIFAELTGKLLYNTESKEALPCVGDWVVVEYLNDGEFAVIHDILPRKTFLRRKSAGNKVEFQMIAANIDFAFIIQSCDLNFNLSRLERYLIMVKEGKVEPIILLSKIDLIDKIKLEQLIYEIKNANINATIIPFSNFTGIGIDEIKSKLEKGKTYCLIGSSGVGKTSLINKLLGEEVFETKEIRQKDGRGRHTTTYRQLIVINNGALLIDTPGMRELALIGAEDVIEESFSDIHELSKQCKFSDCTHTVEPDCAVINALNSGQLDNKRYRRYLKLLKESQFYEMSYIEKRKKDKSFGKMIKAVKQGLKKRKPGF